MAGMGYEVVPFAALPLLWPAVLNGYPLVFSDTGTYLSQAVNHYLGWDRPVFYSLFLLPLHLTLTTWPVVIVQALLTAATLHQVRRALLPWLAAWWLIPLTGLLSVATSLPWLASQLMPDLFTGLLVLALGLLAGASRRLSCGERLWLAGFTTFMLAVHQSHLPLLLPLLPALVWLRHQQQLGATSGWGWLLAAPALACAALVGANLAGHHRASLAPYGNVFLLTRVIYDGPGLRALQRDCPSRGWRLCPYLAQFPDTPDRFLWAADGPLVRAGGAKQVSAEADEIIVEALRAEPGAEARAMLANAWRQLGLFATGDGLTAWPDTVSPWIRRDFPAAEAAAYAASRQSQGRLAVPTWLGRVHRAVALGGVACCLLALPVVGRRAPLLAGFVALGLLALPANALITGGLSGPHDRYQSRVMWLPPLLAVLALPALARRTAA